MLQKFCTKYESCALVFKELKKYENRKKKHLNLTYCTPKTS